MVVGFKFLGLSESFTSFLTSLLMFIVFSGFLFWFLCGVSVILYPTIFCILGVVYLWYLELLKERILGWRKILEQDLVKFCMLLFILREVCFFLSFFWRFYAGFFSPSVEVGFIFPSVGLVLFSPYSVPFLNTLILLTSGLTVTVWHYIVIKEHVKRGYLFLTVVLGVYFLCLQIFEYKEGTFNICSSFYGSVFYLGTGFHGLHVFLGVIILFLLLLKVLVFFSIPANSLMVECVI